MVRGNQAGQVAYGGWLHTVTIRSRSAVVSQWGGAGRNAVGRASLATSQPGASAAGCVCSDQRLRRHGGAVHPSAPPHPPTLPPVALYEIGNTGKKTIPKAYWPILAFQDLRSPSDSSVAAFRCGPEYFLGALANNYYVIWFGCTSQRSATSASVCSPFRTTSATFDLGLRSSISTPSSRGLLLLSLAIPWPFNLELSTYSNRDQFYLSRIPRVRNWISNRLKQLDQ